MKDELKNVHGKSILNIGTCNLHPVHTAFSKGLGKMSFDFDKLTHNNLHFFFKYSSARRADYGLCAIVTDVEIQVMLRHVSSRWLSLKKVLVRILDQWKNLKKYFLEDLPKEKNFDREIRDTERYRDIVRALKSEETRLYMAYAIYVADIMESFLLRFQSKAPKKHLIYEGIGQLLFDVISNFIKTAKLMESVDRRKEACELGLLAVKNLKTHVV